MRKKLNYKFFLIITWISLVIVCGLYARQIAIGSVSEAGIFLILTIGILSGPFGWMCYFIYGALLSKGLIGVSGEFETFLIWLCAGVCGYVQWFVLVPKLWKLLRRNRSRKSNSQ